MWQSFSSFDRPEGADGCDYYMPLSSGRDATGSRVDLVGRNKLKEDLKG